MDVSGGDRGGAAADSAGEREGGYDDRRRGYGCGDGVDRAAGERGGCGDEEKLGENAHGRDSETLGQRAGCGLVTKVYGGTGDRGVPRVAGYMQLSGRDEKATPARPVGRGGGNCWSGFDIGGDGRGL